MYILISCAFLRVCAATLLILSLIRYALVVYQRCIIYTHIAFNKNIYNIYTHPSVMCCNKTIPTHSIYRCVCVQKEIQHRARTTHNEILQSFPRWNWDMRCARTKQEKCNTRSRCTGIIIVMMMMMAMMAMVLYCCILYG